MKNENVFEFVYDSVADQDSYKPSHWCQYVDGMTGQSAHFVSRGGLFKTSTLFGMQYFIDQYLSKRVTREQVKRAAKRLPMHGLPFNEPGWMRIVEKHDGILPVVVRSLPEGTVVPTKTALFTVDSRDDELAWLPTTLETRFVRLWYPSTIAISSREQVRDIKKWLDLSSDTPDVFLPSRLHDFGARGCTTWEQSVLGGAAHLLSSQGTDTYAALEMIDVLYGCEMAGYSLPAAEHSTVCSWGREREFDFYRHFVKTNLTDRIVPVGVPKFAACASDAYNVFEAVKFWCSSGMRAILKASGGTLVIRPDSGEIIPTLQRIFGILEQELGSEITRNQKGYKLLPSYLAIIQGDGINRDSTPEILEHIVRDLGWSSQNIAFGSGGGLLQDVSRDTQKFKFMLGSITVNGEERDVSKDPVTDQGKRSQAGRLDTIRDSNGEFVTVKLAPGQERHPRSEFVTTFDCGPTEYRANFADCRERMKL